MRNVLALLALAAMLCACAKLAVESVDKTIEQRDRQELVRCQEGYTAACRHWQEIQVNYQSAPIGGLGGY